MEVNAKGTFLGTKAVIPLMRRAGGGSHHQHIVRRRTGRTIMGRRVQRLQGRSPPAGQIDRAIQYARDGIRANSVHPGAIDTRMLAGSSGLIGDSEAFNRPMGRMGTPEEIAYGVVFLASDESSFMTGTELVIDGGKLSGQWRLADTPYGMQG